MIPLRFSSIPVGARFTFWSRRYSAGRPGVCIKLDENHYQYEGDENIIELGTISALIDLDTLPTHPK